MTTWGDMPFNTEGKLMISKSDKLKLLRGLLVKEKRLRALVRDHLNAEGWDTEQYSKDAARLSDEIIDIAATLRNELQ